MKNLPDKIYITPHFDRRYFSKEIDDTSVEYIRKDTFVEKVLKYLDENFYFNNLRYSIESGIFDSMEEMFEDFKKIYV